MLINLLTVLASVYLLILIFREFFDGITSLTSKFSSWFGSKRVIENSVEEPVDEADGGRYNITAFKKRMAELKKDENGLYDIEEKAKTSLNTGVEIITEAFEYEQDKLVGR